MASPLCYTGKSEVIIWLNKKMIPVDVRIHAAGTEIARLVRSITAETVQEPTAEKTEKLRNLIPKEHRDDPHLWLNLVSDTPAFTQ